jgi:hypothetical protein
MPENGYRRKDVGGQIINAVADGNFRLTSVVRPEAMRNTHDTRLLLV